MKVLSHSLPCYYHQSICSGVTTTKAPSQEHYVNRKFKSIHGHSFALVISTSSTDNYRIHGRPEGGVVWFG